MKKITFSIILFLSILGVSLAVAPMSKHSFLKASSASCEHVGNHYTQRDATETQSGCKDYYVCCDCHESFVGVGSNEVGLFLRGSASNYLQLNLMLPSSYKWTGNGGILATDDDFNLDNSGTGANTSAGWFGRDDADYQVLTVHFNNNSQEGDTWVLRKGSIFKVQDSLSNTKLLSLNNDCNFVFTNGAWAFVGGESKPVSGTWTEAGVATVTNLNETDPRYIPQIVSGTFTMNKVHWSADWVIQIVTSSVPVGAAEQVSIGVVNGSTHIEHPSNITMPNNWQWWSETMVGPQGLSGAIAGDTLTFKEGLLLKDSNSKIYKLTNTFSISYDGSGWVSVVNYDFTSIHYSTSTLAIITTDNPKQNGEDFFFNSFDSNKIECSTGVSVGKFHHWDNCGVGPDSISGAVRGSSIKLKAGLTASTSGHVYKNTSDFTIYFDGTSWTTTPVIDYIDSISSVHYTVGTSGFQFKGYDLGCTSDNSPLSFTGTVKVDGVTSNSAVFYGYGGNNTIYLASIDSDFTNKTIFVSSGTLTSQSGQSFAILEDSYLTYNGFNWVFGNHSYVSSPEDEMIFFADLPTNFESEEKVIEYKEAGFNVGLLTNDYYAGSFDNSTEQLILNNGFENGITTLAKHGMSAWIRNYHNLNNFFDGVGSELANQKNVTGYYMADEAFNTNALASDEQWNQPGVAFDQYEKLVNWKNTYDKNDYFHINLVPSSSYNHWSSDLSVSKTTGYKSEHIACYIDTIVKKLNGGHASIGMDHYPFVGSNNIDDNYLYDLLSIATSVKEYNASRLAGSAVGNMSNCIQSFTSEGTPITSTNDIMFQLFTSLACGTSVYEYFGYEDRPSIGFEGSLLDSNGQKTNVYNYVKAANAAIKKMGSLLTSYTWNGLIAENGKCANDSDYTLEFNKVKGNAVVEEKGKYIWSKKTKVIYDVDLTTALSSTAVNNYYSKYKVVIGEFVNGGNKAYLASNYYSPKANNDSNFITMNFDSSAYRYCDAYYIDETGAIASTSFDLTLTSGDATLYNIPAGYGALFVPHN